MAAMLNCYFFSHNNDDWPTCWEMIHKQLRYKNNDPSNSILTFLNSKYKVINVAQYSENPKRYLPCQHFYNKQVSAHTKHKFSLLPTYS